MLVVGIAVEIGWSRNDTAFQPARYAYLQGKFARCAFVDSNGDVTVPRIAGLLTQRQLFTTDIKRSSVRKE